MRISSGGTKRVGETGPVAEVARGLPLWSAWFDSFANDFTRPELVKSHYADVLPLE